MQSSRAKRLGEYRTKLGRDGRVAVQSCSLLESSRVVELERFGDLV